LHLTGIMTQYITEFGSRSDVWVQWVDALTHETHHVQQATD
jgi:hypothetical protein